MRGEGPGGVGDCAEMAVKDDEYRALRATIQQRGTARILVLPLIFVGWAATAVATAAVITVAVSTLVPLLVLVAGFEAIFALHVNVERVGRYLQVYFEAPEETARWENVAMAYGRAFAGGGIDALFAPMFWVAALLNFIPAMLSGPMAIDWAVVGAVHALFVVRVWSARMQAGRQRAIDLERYTKLKSESATRDSRGDENSLAHSVNGVDQPQFRRSP